MNRIICRKKIISLFIALALIPAAFARDFYWENPVRITNADCRFPSAVTNGRTTYIFWQDIDQENSRIWLSCQYLGSDGNWVMNSRFAGPFPYSGDVPDMYSAAVSPSGTIAAAVLSGPKQVAVYVSSDRARTFTRADFPVQDKPLVAPRIYASQNGGFRLFSSLGENESFSMRTSSSSDGYSWSSFTEFQPAAGMMNPFVPVLAVEGSRDVVVFQAQMRTGNRLSYQLYLTESANNGVTWSTPVLVTGAESLAAGDTRQFTNYHNQRPFLFVFGGIMYIAWERTYYTSENASIYTARLSDTGIVPGSAEEISNQGNANRAVLFSFDNTLSVVWFDTRRGIETVHLAQKNGFLWDESALSSGRNADLFAFPVIAPDGTSLSFIWQENARGSSSIFRLDPDKSVPRPSISALSYKEGKHSTAQKVRLRVNLPADSSGIAGFSWIWTQDDAAEPPAEFMNLPSQNTVTVTADQDGTWYLKARVLDYAGNWSAPSQISYYLDHTPPLPPVIMPPETDRFGFVSSNTFALNWQNDPSDTDVAGYTWNLQYIEPIDKHIAETKRHPIKISDDEVNVIAQNLLAAGAEKLQTVSRPPERLMGTRADTSFTNRRNGLYAFSVAAIDEVGNIGKPTVQLIILNKYVPVTYLLSVDSRKSVFGDVTLTLTGGGFTYDGTISKIYLTRTGKTPYDLTLERGVGQFRVVSDNLITDVKVGRDLEKGRYRIGLVHPDRGLYMSGAVLSISENGTVKIEKEYDYVPSWQPAEETSRWNVQMGDILMWTVFVLALAGMVFAVRGIVQTARDSVTARLEAHALITGDVMPQVKKMKSTVLKQRGTSLKVKLVGFTSFLVIMIILLVSIPLGFNMTRIQERTLSQGLEQRVNVLLDSLATGARAYMPAQNVLEMSYLPGQSASLDEASYATITGIPADNSNTKLTYVWATNDKNIDTKIDTSGLTFGRSAITDDTVVQIAARCAELNTEAEKEAGEIATNISELNAEGAQLALKTDAASVARREEIAQITTQLTNRLNTTLNDLSTKGAGSFPQFNNGNLDRTTTEYLFYRPVLYRQGSSPDYVRGIVLVQISTHNLISAVDQAQRSVILTATVIAIIAVIIGAFGSFLVASIIIKPIRKLAAHVAQIGQTKDKEKLAGKDIVITSKDEIGQLGETVNEMTHGLIKAALDEKLLLDGKIVQQTFLPLASGDQGKQTVAQLKEDKVECFGYYEGASGVSGDYFDYKKLDARWYVLIKCDASGHGVPAALIMTIVATLFRKYFDSWSYQKNGTKINELVTQINDFIESLGMKGKFATIIVCLFDTASGDVYMCNAGDNIVHIYDSASQKEKTLTLLETPAAGPLPSFMVDMKGGFKVEKKNLKHGDVLFLYTDGIEEATRKFRDASFAVMKCAEPGMKEGDVHGNHKVGSETEQMEPERVQAIIESVFAHTSYTLEKFHNPVPGESLTFDFTKCAGTIEEAIIALASVEKVFRMYKSPDVTPTDTVRVDRRIDQFLKEHFSRYDYYCASKTDSGKEQNYTEYTNLREDDQLDDLTLLAVRRP